MLSVQLNSRVVVPLSIILVTLAVAPAFYHDLWNPDEPRNAQLAQGMVQEGHWIIPQINGNRFIEQPPLHAWLVSLPTRWWGAGLDHAWVPRVPSMILNLILLVITYRLGKKYWGAGVGVLAAICLAVTVEYFLVYQRVVVDTSLTLCVTLAMMTLVELFDREVKTISWKAAILLGIALGFSFLAKNLIGVTFVGLVAVALFLRNRSVYFSKGAWLKWGTAGLLFLIVPAPWLIALYLQSPEALSELLYDNTVGRFFSTGKHNPPLLEFLHRGAAVMLPTLVLFLISVWRRPWWKNVHSNERERGICEGLFWWVVLPWVLVLISGSKREVYLLPITPAIALLSARQLAAWWELPVFMKVSKVFVWGVSFSLVVVSLIAGIFITPVPWPIWGVFIFQLSHFIRWWRSKNSDPNYDARGIALVSILSLLVSVSLIGFGVKNQKESYEPLMEYLMEQEEKGFEIIGVELPLREISALPYYLGHDLQNIPRSELGSKLNQLKGQKIFVSRDPYPEELMGKPTLEFKVRRTIHVIQWTP